MSVAVSRRLFNVDEYYRMAEAGIFTEDDRVELIQGEILTMPAIGSPDASCVDRLLRIFVPEGWIVNLPEQVVELYRNPTPDGSREVRLARPGEVIAPLAFPRLRLAVAAILGPPATSRRARGAIAP